MPKQTSGRPLHPLRRSRRWGTRPRKSCAAPILCTAAMRSATLCPVCAIKTRPRVSASQSSTSNSFANGSRLRCCKIWTASSRASSRLPNREAWKYPTRTSIEALLVCCPLLFLFLFLIFFFLSFSENMSTFKNYRVLANNIVEQYCYIVHTSLSFYFYPCGVCVCVCVHMYVCVHMCVFVRVRVFVHTCKCT